MTTPGIPAPDGSFILGSGYGQDITEESAKAIMKGAPLESFTDAQNAHNSEVKDPITTIGNNVQGHIFTLTNHENRITILESGEIIYEFELNDTWTKPAGMNHHRLIAIAGGGGGGKAPGASGGNAKYGGGQGGYAETTLTDAACPASIDVILGGGGAGATADNANGSTGGNTVLRNSATLAALLTAGGALGGRSTPASAGTGTHPEWNAKGGQGFPDPDDGEVPAQPGTNGYLCTGGAAGTGSGGSGGTGGDCPPGNIGPGAGGGGGNSAVPGTGGKGGNGGYPGGGAGSGGGWGFAGVSGNGGNAGQGKAWIISSPFA